MKPQAIRFDQDFDPLNAVYEDPQDVHPAHLLPRHL